jgi:hypothetical protein
MPNLSRLGELRACALAQANTDAVRAATVRPMYGALAGGAPHLAPADPGPYAVGAGGQCARNALCDKPCGHPGFCSGPRAAPAGERAPGGRARRPCNPGAAAAPRCSTLRRVTSCEPDTGSDSDGGGGSAGSGSARGGWPGIAGRPLRASQGGEQHRRGAPAHGPRATAPLGTGSGAPATRAAAAGAARRGAAAAADASELGVATQPADLRPERFPSGYGLAAGVRARWPAACGASGGGGELCSSVRASPGGTRGGLAGADGVATGMVVVQDAWARQVRLVCGAVPPSDAAFQQRKAQSLMSSARQPVVSGTGLPLQTGCRACPPRRALRITLCSVLQAACRAVRMQRLTLSQL